MSRSSYTKKENEKGHALEFQWGWWKNQSLLLKKKKEKERKRPAYSNFLPSCHRAKRKRATHKNVRIAQAQIKRKTKTKGMRPI